MVVSVGVPVVISFGVPVVMAGVGVPVVISVGGVGGGSLVGESQNSPVKPF